MRSAQSGKFIIPFVLFLASLWWLGYDALRCRVCNQALTADDCTRSVDCAAGEDCYMDELITDQLAIVYTGGCRATDVCYRAAQLIGKRDLVACSKCCNTTLFNGVECNVPLCGIKSRPAGQQCLFCDATKPGGSDVDSPQMCNTVTTCQKDEICGAEMFSRANHQTHRYSCFNSTDCILRTQLALQDLDRCRDPHKLAAGMCGKLKRNSHLCTACCGDSRCNDGTCFEVLDRLYKLWKAGALDFNTLKANGTIASHSG